MRLYQINTVHGDILYEGTFKSFKHCLETAVLENTKLYSADLRHQNLVNAELDDALLKDARFDGSNLMGANLSGAMLSFSNFDNAALQNTYLCEAQAKNCRFSGTHFGATDITSADISYSLFDTLSAFTLNYRDCDDMSYCKYQNNPGQTINFSRRPVYVAHLDWPVILFENHLKIGSYIDTYNNWFTPGAQSIQPRNIAPVRKPVYEFFCAHKELLEHMAICFFGFSQAGSKIYRGTVTET